MNALSRSLRAAAIATSVLATAASPPPGPSATPPGAVVRIAGFAYHPGTIHVRAGDRVTFVNADDEAHTVTADDRSFDSAGLDTNDTWQHVFSKPGTYRYFCALHPYMTGVVDVRAAAPATN